MTAASHVTKMHTNIGCTKVCTCLGDSMPPTKPRSDAPSMKTFWERDGSHRAARRLPAMHTRYAGSNRFLYGRLSEAGLAAAAWGFVAAGASASSSTGAAGKRLEMQMVESSVAAKPPKRSTPKRTQTPKLNWSCTSGSFINAGAKNSVAHFTKKALPGSSVRYTTAAGSGPVSCLTRSSAPKMASMPTTDWMPRSFSSAATATKKATPARRTVIGGDFRIVWNTL
mmetsp:Transcript_48794/g.156040  ORF Transcript_48794/g.156040 Transcript_48794/m.156040 type:complete len:226 (-) Transcript_48794:884-1561(-)